MFQPARGTRDFLPDEMRRHNWVIDNIRDVFEAYGYDPLGTPAFESWDMLKIKSGEDAVNQIYYFRDKSDRELGLRFEWTASLARVVASHRELPKPFKRYAIGPVWRYERPSEMSRREFWQMDVDVVGVPDPIADAEVIAVAVDCLRRIGFEGFIIRLNDRRLLEALAEAAGLPVERRLDIFRAVDKMDKIGYEGVLEELSRLGAPTGASEKLLEMTSSKGDPGRVLEGARADLKGLQKGMMSCETLSSIVECSKGFGIEKFMVVDLGLARGLDYYTGPVFEIYDEEFEGAGSIAGGGRYDELVELFGGDPTPMTGISMGVWRLVTLLEKKGVFEGLDLGPLAYVVYASEGLRFKAVEVAQTLRRAGISTEMDLLGRGIGKQLDIANKKGVKKVVIVGERELEEGCVALRDMETAEQRNVRLYRLLEEF
jgi:histidyl-tRNA synthetase